MEAPHRLIQNRAYRSQDYKSKTKSHGSFNIKVHWKGTYLRISSIMSTKEAQFLIITWSFINILKMCVVIIAETIFLLKKIKLLSLSI